MSRAAWPGRSVARLAAVQALYQMDVSGHGAETVVREFHDYRFDREMEGERLAAADEDWFARVVRGVTTDQIAIDRNIRLRLAAGWKLERLDATVRAILRSGTFELIRQSDVPIEVVIDEYVEIAKSFFEGPEAGFVNAALDAIAADVRPG
ncbi:MAG TPA: transcription antitermination factor NusB [Caulobacteraceae bacterium]|jgi:N utilization substance protein B|nr:transcription antitermination factor NusB [Caulobacteraceae bacterium]